MYSPQDLIDLSIGQIIDDPNYRYGHPFGIEELRQTDGIPRPGTSGTYIFRVYNPFLQA